MNKLCLFYEFLYSAKNLLTLIKKCEDLFEQRREKRKKYIMNKRKFREESSFDKTLSNEKEINKKTGVYI